jgi:hypothetical protein
MLIVDPVRISFTIVVNDHKQERRDLPDQAAKLIIWAL